MVEKQRRGGFLFNRHLDPAESLEEVLFGLIMVLTFTLGAGLKVSEGAAGVRELLLAALGCNLAWGIIDAIMFVMGRSFERTRKIRFMETLAGFENEEEMLEKLESMAGHTLRAIEDPDERKQVFRGIVKIARDSQPHGRGVTVDDMKGAVWVFFLVFGTALPAMLPFLLLSSEPHLSLRVSNAILCALLFLVGFHWARFTGSSRLGTGLMMLATGLIMVLTAILLGG